MKDDLSGGERIQPNRKYSYYKLSNNYDCYRNMQSRTMTAGRNTYPSKGKGFPKSSFPRKAQITIQ